MTGTAKKTKYYLDIDPDLRNRVKAFAAFKGKTMRDWLTEAIIAKLLKVRCLWRIILKHDKIIPRSPNNVQS
jgi:hypothetical protein